MRNPEKSALRKQFRRARAQMSTDERNAATKTINRLLKPYIKKGRKIGVYWPMGKELQLDGFVRAAQKRGAKLYLPYIEPNTRRMWFTPYPADGAKQERKRGRAKLHVPQFTGKKIRVHQTNPQKAARQPPQKPRADRGSGYQPEAISSARCPALGSAFALLLNAPIAIGETGIYSTSQMKDYKEAPETNTSRPDDLY